MININFLLPELEIRHRAGLKSRSWFKIKVYMLLGFPNDGIWWNRPTSDSNSICSQIEFLKIKEWL